MANKTSDWKSGLQGGAGSASSAPVEEPKPATPEPSENDARYGRYISQTRWGGTICLSAEKIEHGRIVRRAIIAKFTQKALGFNARGERLDPVGQLDVRNIPAVRQGKMTVTEAVQRIEASELYGRTILRESDWLRHRDLEKTIDAQKAQLEAEESRMRNQARERKRAKQLIG